MSETVMDIVREMRSKADAIAAVTCEEPAGWQELEAKMCSLNKEASRIEAAYNRDLGDLAALRLALRKCVNALDLGLRYPKGYPGQDDDIAKVIKDGEAALAAPARNIDRFDDWHDALVAWAEGPADTDRATIEEFGDDVIEQAEGMWGEWFDDTEQHDFLEWAFSKATEGGAK